MTRQYIRIMLSTILGAISAHLSLAEGRAYQNAAATKYVIEHEAIAQIKWTDAELAFREAMESDPTTTTRDGYFPQDRAVEAWQQLLERDDLTEPQQAFAWLRIGSLYAYNLDPSKGEAPDYKAAESALARARELLVDSISFEAINANTVYAGLPGEPHERVERLAAAFRWFASRTDQDIEQSALLVNRSGFLIDRKYFPDIAHLDNRSVAERKVYITDRLAEGRERLRQRISDEILSSQNPDVMSHLLDSIEEFAAPDEMTEWNSILSELMFRYGGHGGNRAITVLLLCLLMAPLAFLGIKRLVLGIKKSRK